MKRLIVPLALGLLILAWGFSFTMVTAQEQNSPDLVPANWLPEWENPSARMRPLQIVHGQDLTDPAVCDYFRDECGLGGVVFNVSGSDGYVRNQTNWDRFVKGAKNADAAGLRMWIYDENGYPSLKADGAVLENNPELVSKELVWDKDAEEPFYVRDCYEFTHSCNSYAPSRRYPNPLNQAADDKFLELTHKRYKKELGDDLYNKVEAFFTDEPSMMAVNIGQIPEDVRKNVQTIDPIDPDKKSLPMLPWCDDMLERYQERWGEDLSKHYISLFAGDTPEDKRIRARYWKLVEELYAERYYGTIRDWCRAAGGPVSSGHTLREENPVAHVPLDGNKLTALKALDIPGLDMLSSNAYACQWGNWLAAAFPCSAAYLKGVRRTMTEVSDFSEKGATGHMVQLPSMEATAAWEAAWGVTDFTLYYSITGGENSPYRNEASHKAYCDYVGRLNAVLLDAQPVRPVLLYYPIETMQEEYIPSAENVATSAQSTKMTKAIESFVQVGRALMRAQIPFTLIDGQSIMELSDKDLAGCTSMIIPNSADVPQKVLDRLDALWQDCGTRIFRAGDEHPYSSPELLPEEIVRFGAPRLELITVGDAITEGVFHRDGRLIFQLTNLTDAAWDASSRLVLPKYGPFSTRAYGTDGWAKLDPKTGQCTPLAAAAEDGTVKFNLTLNNFETVFVVAPEEFQLTGAMNLFDGQTLSGWKVSIRGEEPGVDPAGVFTAHDGMIHVSGQKYGGISTDNSFSNYRLSVEYKWGEKTWPPRENNARDSGVLIHSFGSGGTWRPSIEANLLEGGIGDFWMVTDKEHGIQATCDVIIRDEGTPLFRRVYSPEEGKPVTIVANADGCFAWSGHDPNWVDQKGFHGTNDLDQPGQWNEITVIARDDTMDILVNGTRVNFVYGLVRTSGAIQLQSEGAEIFFRNIKIEPLD
ncbi:MAG: DUF1080 domain-containing protein [Thermoguttaceae bacterium]|nr:DUF1080 domain-containing protein [Thermoguttaceae bacterium]